MTSILPIRLTDPSAIANIPSETLITFVLHPPGSVVSIRIIQTDQILISTIPRHRVHGNRFVHCEISNKPTVSMYASLMIAEISVQLRNSIAVIASLLLSPMNHHWEKNRKKVNYFRYFLAPVMKQINLDDSIFMKTIQEKFSFYFSFSFSSNPNFAINIESISDGIRWSARDSTLSTMSVKTTPFGAALSDVHFRMNRRSISSFERGKKSLRLWLYVCWPGT